MFSFKEDMALMSEHRRDLLRAARMHQLYQQSDESRAHFGERVMVLLGDLMISGGEKLKSRSNVPYRMEAWNS